MLFWCITTVLKLGPLKGNRCSSRPPSSCPGIVRIRKDSGVVVCSPAGFSAKQYTAIDVETSPRPALARRHLYMWCTKPLTPNRKKMREQKKKKKAIFVILSGLMAGLGGNVDMCRTKQRTHSDHSLNNLASLPTHSQLWAMVFRYGAFCHAPLEARAQQAFLALTVCSTPEQEQPAGIGT